MLRARMIHRDQLASELAARDKAEEPDVGEVFVGGYSVRDLTPDERAVYFHDVKVLRGAKVDRPDVTPLTLYNWMLWRYLREVTWADLQRKLD